MKTGAEYSVVLSVAASLVCVAGCFSPDPRSIDGALTYAAQAAEAGDTVKLFRILDQRGRHALDATVKLRQESAVIVRDNYPAAEVDAAIQELGDAVDAKDTESLFKKRCDSSCVEWFSSQVAAAAEQRVGGAEVSIRTVRDTNLTLHKGNDGWYGIVWQTEQLAAERERAARDLAQIQDNARVYRERKRLEEPK